tara:strand:+ start:11459 stop:11992 length:534 start_codon:yes stop_codon:yes gene_type:complete
MECYKDWNKITESCKNCSIKEGCEHNSVFIESSVFVNIILYQSKDPIKAEKSFNHYKNTCITYTSHLCIGKIFDRLIKAYNIENKINKSNATDLFYDLCERAKSLLNGVTLLEIDTDTLRHGLDLLRTEGKDYENRDRIILATAISHKCLTFLSSDNNFIERIKKRDLNCPLKITKF